MVFGTTGSWPSTFTNLPGNTTFLNGYNGVEFDGISGSEAGFTVTVGDMNGDGIADVIIGARWPHQAA